MLQFNFFKIHNQDEMGEACGTWGRGEMHMIFSLKSPEGKKPLERPGCRWEDNIKLDLRDNSQRGVKDGCFPYRKNIY
jgi:hypothetical protein